MTEEDEEHIYKLAVNVGPKKDRYFSIAEKNIRKFYGKEGFLMLENIFLYENKKAAKWIFNNKDEYLKKLQLRNFDIAKLKANQISIKQFYEKWRYFVSKDEIEENVKTYPSINKNSVSEKESV